jgi:protein involved in polysaccharide export with SLBB domain
MVATSDIGELYSFSLKDGLVADGNKDFVLEPYDEVVVHQSPSYNVQRHFTINGEVNFPGTYSITSREERVSDLVKKAGGLTQFAYTKGTRLTRVATAEELRVANEMVDIVETMADSVVMEARRAASGTFNVAIDLDAAMANPGGEADVILREGDVLDIPVESNVIRIQGAVKFPTAVNFDPKMRAKDYINAAGGYSERARRSKAYVVSMGGRAKKLRSWTKVDPGSEIFVPEKERRQRSEFNPSTITAIASAAASLGSLSMTTIYIINYLNNNKK